MKLQRILPFAKQLLQNSVENGEVAVDATIGNGHDTVYLAKLVGSTGQVYGFDIQKDAIMNTTERLKEEQLEQQVTLIQSGHENVKSNIPSHLHGRIAGAIFNLGYLPGGDKEIVTTPNTTISAIKQLLEMMKPEGIIVIVIYHGHEQGQLEREEVMNYVKSIEPSIAHVLQYQYINKLNNPPYIIAIEKC